MKKINTKDVAEIARVSPKGKFGRVRKPISEALGRKPESMDLMERQPFDVEICRVPPGKHAFPYHSHSAQWEFYHVISGKGVVRHKDGTTAVETGDAFIFGPGEAHTTCRRLSILVRPPRRSALTSPIARLPERRHGCSCRRSRTAG